MPKTSTDNTTVASPDRRGHREVTIPGAPFVVIVEPYARSWDSPGRRVYVDNDLATDRCPELVDLIEQEDGLGDRRFAERGSLAEVDFLYDRMNRLWEEHKLAVARDALAQLDGVLDGDLTEAAAGAYFNLLAGCSACPCSPGVTAGASLFYQGQQVDLRIESRRMHRRIDGRA